MGSPNEGDHDDPSDELNKMRRMVAHYRAACRRLEVSLKDYKSKSAKEVSSLKDKLKVD